ncbi:Uncharacterised protein [Klebsiella pneumoniae]|uniref:Uncharacterized protein n=1 Tax=Klebsiella pneumoniae TaxID=573 RepID=A0A447S6E4_KLEPN|nr:Uncharacterised protein [Klebsiella pneumoniae]
MASMIASRSYSLFSGKQYSKLICARRRELFARTPYQTTEFAEERIAKGWRRQRNTGEGKDPQPGAPVARQ